MRKIHIKGDTVRRVAAIVRELLTILITFYPRERHDQDDYDEWE